MHPNLKWTVPFRFAVAALGAVIACSLVSPGAAVAAKSGTVVAGDARFRVLTPTLIRVEYAADGNFEDRPTLNAIDRDLGRVRYDVNRSTNGALVIRTKALRLGYRRRSGPFGQENLSLRLRGKGPGRLARPNFPPAPGPPAGPPALEVSPYTVAQEPGYLSPTSGNLGGWYRALDLAGGAVPLHDGLLSRDGWYLLDDSHTALLTEAEPGFAPRPEREGAYQDGYLFGYGRDYIRGLADLRALTGPAPLLPRQAFGVWYSRYFNYRQSDYPPILERFRAEQVPLDVLMVDTDFKSPHAWNGWNWDPAMFPDPPGFFDWAHREGIAVSLNTHPSITAEDPRFAQAQAVAGRELPPDPTTRCRAFVEIGDVYGKGIPGSTNDCRVFDWTRQGDLDSYLSLHEPFERDGLDFWWLDWCCDESSAVAPGLTQDTWINQAYAERSFSRGSRWPVLSRVGANVFDPDEAGLAIWGEHRNAIHFTGDARPTWEMLDFQTAFTAAEGAIGMPYVSHDIGGFGSITSDGTAGRHLPEELYVRWVQSGAFQPILRLHSDHGDRLPWDYPGRAEEIATEFLQLRGELVPYLYTLARRAHDKGLPITERAYLRWPRFDEAYEFDRQYLFGSQLLVAPVGVAGDPATKEVWFPPGRWTDVFTGERHRGPAVEELLVPLERMPVFARPGAIVPRQAYRPEGNVESPELLVVDAYPGRRGAFTVYEDEGDGLGHERGRFARTRISQRRSGDSVAIKIGRVRGDYPGRPSRRAYELRIYDGGSEPAEVVRTGRLPTDRAAKIAVDLRG
ncbi:MAG: TIM-barrel domain-containing protein [Solirubrobacterales bacterium]